MPELPEVETIVRQLKRVLRGRQILDFQITWPKLIANLSVKEFKRRIQNQTIKRVERRGKFILLDLGKDILVIHLKLTGRLLFREEGEKRDDYQIASLLLSAPSQRKSSLRRELRYADARKFGRFWLIQKEGLVSFKELQKLGPDALQVSFQEFSRLLQSKKARIKTVLMDQANLSGLGNIYTDEALFRAKIHPLTPAHLLSEKQREDLYQSIHYLLRRAIQRKGTSDQYYRDSYGRKGEYQNYLKIYGREGRECVRCKSKIQYTKLNQRGTRFCPRCQRSKLNFKRVRQ